MQKSPVSPEQSVPRGKSVRNYKSPPESIRYFHSRNPGCGSSIAKNRISLRLLLPTSSAGNKLYRTGRTNEGRIMLRAEITEIGILSLGTSGNNMQINYIVALGERQCRICERAHFYLEASPGSNLFKCDSGTHDDCTEMTRGRRG